MADQHLFGPQRPSLLPTDIQTAQSRGRNATAQAHLLEHYQLRSRPLGAPAQWEGHLPGAILYPKET
jgi:hypothetical protein